MSVLFYGICVHRDFANAVRAQDLPGIGRDGVEQSFNGLGEIVRYDLTQASEPTLCCATEADGLLQYLTSKRGMLRWRLQLQRGIVVIHKWVPKFQSLFCMR